MVRILLPLAVIATLIFAPIYSETIVSGEFGENKQAYTGYKYVGNTIDCWRAQNFSVSDECEPKGGAKGMAIFAAIFVSAVAAVLGFLSILPVIGRLFSGIIMVAGIVALAAIGFFLVTQMGNDGGSVEYGAYIAGAGGLLTLISGLAGMRR
ncbi:MAG: hypothetical protein AAGC56_12605 [Pseudomonadota bacterium]